MYEEAACFFNDTRGPCSKDDWQECGDIYKQLELITLSLLGLVWVLGSAYYLLREFRRNGNSRSTERLHDPICQGVAFAESVKIVDNTSDSIIAHYSWIRMIKLTAIWLEWPALTLTPLRVLLLNSNIELDLIDLELSFHGIVDFLIFVVMAVYFLMAFSFRAIMHTDVREMYLKIMYPMIYDLFYIIATNVFIRVALCRNGAHYLKLFDGSTCDCVDRYPFFMALGGFSFILLFFGALSYKATVEHKNAALNLRFQISFQIVMVFVRSSNAFIFSVLDRVNKNDSISSGNVSRMMIAYTATVIALCMYCYKFQPCVGSGLIPNNIRVLSFSSSGYVSILVLIQIVVGAVDRDNAYSILYLLIPIPLVWIIAWGVNTTRAIEFHVPREQISSVLASTIPRLRVVGVIAALHVANSKTNEVEKALIIRRLNDILANKHEPNILRMHTARTIWNTRLALFEQTSIVLQDSFGSSANHILKEFSCWKKDRGNLDRPGRKKHLTALQYRHYRRGKTDITSSEHRAKKVSDVLAKNLLVPAVLSVRKLPDVKSMKTKSSGLFGKFKKKNKVSMLPKPLINPLAMVPISSDRVASIEGSHKNLIQKKSTPDIDTSTFFFKPARLKIKLQNMMHEKIQQKDRDIICINMTVEELATTNQQLTQYILEVLFCSSSLWDLARVEAAKLALDMYRKNYLVLSQRGFVFITCVLCQCEDDPKLSMDAIYNLRALVFGQDKHNTLEVLRNHQDMISIAACAIKIDFPKTVERVAKILAQILTELQEDVKTGRLNPYIIISPPVIKLILAAYRRWKKNYLTSLAIEDLLNLLASLEKLKRLQYQGPMMLSHRREMSPRDQNGRKCGISHVYTILVPSRVIQDIRRKARDREIGLLYAKRLVEDKKVCESKDACYSQVLTNVARRGIIEELTKLFEKGDAAVGDCISCIYDSETLETVEMILEDTDTAMISMW